MEEKLIICPRCTSNACSEVSNEKLTVWNCFGCGFTSNSTMTKTNKAVTEEIMPELYRALCWDKAGYNWYPNTVILDDKAMVFAEGTSKTDWKWAAVKSKNNKPDMTTKREFNENDFMEALDYIEYFNQK
jgi:hypothetical protein